MYQLSNFLNLVTQANPNFNRMAKSRGWNKRSSLEALIEVLEIAHPNQASAINILEKTMALPASKLKRYRIPLTYLLQNLNETGTQPKDFNWLTNNQVGGMYKFNAAQNKTNGSLGLAVLWLFKHGVRTVISIEKGGATETKAAVESFPDMQWTSCFLADWHAPSVDHLKAYYATVSTNLMRGGVVTHCWGGTGRTGCFLASFLLSSRHSATAQAAFTNIRTMYNAHSVEMKAQYNALARLSDSLGNNASIAYDDPLINHAGGHWHHGHKDDGLDADPGHAGTGATGVDARAMISISGVARSSSPYLTHNANTTAQAV